MNANLSYTIGDTPFSEEFNVELTYNDSGSGIGLQWGEIMVSADKTILQILIYPDKKKPLQFYLKEFIDIIEDGGKRLSVAECVNFDLVKRNGEGDSLVAQRCHLHLPCHIKIALSLRDEVFAYLYFNKIKKVAIIKIPVDTQWGIELNFLDFIEFIKGIMENYQLVLGNPINNED